MRPIRFSSCSTIQVAAGGDDELRVLVNLFDSSGPYQPFVKYDSRQGATAHNWEAADGASLEIGTTGLVEGDGHCRGAAVATMFLDQPTPVPGSGYNADEVEGLWAELGDHNDHLLGDFVGPIAPGPPTAGADNGIDEFSSRFHDFIEQKIKRQRRILWSNLRSDGGGPDEVWNHAVYKFSASFSEESGQDETTLRITNAILANADHGPPTDDLTDRVIQYEYIVKYKPNSTVDIIEASVRNWISAGGAGTFAPEVLIVITNPLWQAANSHVTEANVRSDDAEN